MAKIIREENIIMDLVVLPGKIWQIILRKDLGSRYIGKSYANAVLLPYVVLFDPFCKNFLWQHSKVTYCYAVVALIRVAYEFLISKIGKDRVMVHSDSTGQPRDFWYKLNFFSDSVDVKRYGETTLAAAIGCVFYFSKLDVFFGGLMLCTALICFYNQLEFDMANGQIDAGIRDNTIESEDAQEREKNVSEKMERVNRVEGVDDDDFSDVTF